MDYKAEFIRIFSENVSRPGAQQLLDWLAETLPTDAFLLSLMGQYTPPDTRVFTARANAAL